MVHTRGIDEYYKLRFIWSWVLVISLGVLLFFQCILVILIGCGKINFVNYQTLINIQAVEYFGQIVGMCYIVVKYLFKDPTQNIDEKNTNDKDNKTNNKQGQT